MSRLWSLQRGGAYSEPFTMERPIMLSSRQAPNPAAGFVNDYVTVLESNPAGRDYRDSSYPFIKKSQYIPGSKPLRRYFVCI
jgi:hypothetical protein